jgi:hypothetical protein
MGHLGNLMPPKCILKLSDHISTTGNPWQKCGVLNCENQQNFTSKIWFNLEPDSGTMGQLGNLLIPKSIFKLGDPISTTENPWQECSVLNCENRPNFASQIWNPVPGFTCYRSAGNSNASEIYVHARLPYIYHRESLVGGNGFILGGVKYRFFGPIHAPIFFPIL